MVMMMLLGSHKTAMVQFTLPSIMKGVEWAATLAMALAAFGKLATMGQS